MMQTWNDRENMGDEEVCIEKRPLRWPGMGLLMSLCREITGRHEPVVRSEMHIAGKEDQLVTKRVTRRRQGV